MKLISESHKDGHAALLRLIATALPVLDAELIKCEQKLLEGRARCDNHNAKRSLLDKLFEFFDYPEWEQNAVSIAHDRVNFLIKLKNRASYELTIELDEKESDLLFVGEKQ